MFKQDNYQIIRGLISKEIANIAYKYLLNKRRITKFMHDQRLVSPFNDHWGRLQDDQVPGAWCNYDDLLMATLLQTCKEKIEKEIDIKLVETYTYTRIYIFGNVLDRHKDRPSCAVSSTMALGGDPWPIYVEPTGKGVVQYNEKGEADNYEPSSEPGIKVELSPGDCLLYKGCEIEHWRDKFYGENCAQVFLHYNDASDPKAKENEYDNRPFLGLPNSVRGYYK